MRKKRAVLLTGPNVDSLRAGFIFAEKGLTVAALFGKLWLHSGFTRREDVSWIR
jgi:hypothetical protein